MEGGTSVVQPSDTMDKITEYFERLALSETQDNIENLASMGKHRKVLFINIRFQMRFTCENEPFRMPRLNHPLFVLKVLMNDLRD